MTTSTPRSSTPLTSPTSHPTVRTGRHRLLARLDADWEHLRVARRSLRQVRAWADHEPDQTFAAIVTDLHDLQDLVDATQGYAAGANEVLLRLVELARAGDELAGRIVVQRLLPALLARSRHYRLPDGRDTVTEVVASAWIAVRSYDTERRRHHVAPSLVSDAVFNACRRPLRRAPSREDARPPVLFSRLEHRERLSGLEELAEVMREAERAGVPRPQLDLLRELARAESSAAVASAHGLSARTIRKHRAEAIALVRHAVAA